jgi:hypothetical protein
MKYKTILWVLNKQIEYQRNHKWAWIGNEFICVYRYVPEKATELYTPKQLIDKIKNKINEK